MTKLYVCSPDNINHDDNYKGMYYLISETREVINCGNFNNKWEARTGLYTNSEATIIYTVNKFGQCECTFIEDDDTIDKEKMYRVAKVLSRCVEETI